jgi:glutamate N-acetyltransferase/amino-acid N-acetyltransferase
VCIGSTGVIGVPLPMDRIRRGIDGCLETLTPLGSPDAARAIMTTDTVPKEIAVEVPLEGGVVRIGGIAKGSGMISPNMATMIAVLTTDAAMAPEHLDALLRDCVNVSFNCICVDNDMSTSDNVVCFANGASGVPALAPGSGDHAIFGAALREMCVRLAHLLVRDGEGATKFLEIRVTGARDEAGARTIARSIAHSMLCKTAFFGQDANWGRIACAAGYAGVPFHPEDLCIAIEGLTVVEGGLPASYAEEDAAARMKLRDIRVEVHVGTGPGRCVFWTSDLSYDYVRINADYRS